MKRLEAYQARLLVCIFCGWPGKPEVTPEGYHWRALRISVAELAAHFEQRHGAVVA